jgi:hypothetical protein
MRSRQDSSHHRQNPAQLLLFGSCGAAFSFHWFGLARIDRGEWRSLSAADLGSAERES